MVRTIVRTFVENSVEVQQPKSAEKFVENKRKSKLFLLYIACNSVKYIQKPNLVEKSQKTEC